MSTIKVNTITTATNSEVEVGVPLKILETSAPSASDTHGMLYVKEDGKIYYRHTTGTSGGEVDLTAASTGGVVTSSSNAASATNALVLYSGTGAGGIKSIAGITFDGSDLACAANIDITGDHDLSLKDDDQKIMFGASEDIYLQHDHDRGLKLIHQTGTGSGKPIYLTLQSRESDISLNDKIGVIDFQAINEGTGSAAILVAAGIEAVSEGDFASDNNATKLSFKTASSEAALERMSLSSAGLLTVSGRIITDDGTQATSTTDGSLQTDGGLSVVKDSVFGGDVKLKHDSSVLYFGADNEVTLTHNHNAGLTLNGTLVATTLDISGDIDVDGTTNLDVVDIDGAVQVDSTITVGANDTGYDVKFFGATSGAYMLWDEDQDDLILAGAARVVVPNGQLVLGSTAVTSTAAELNVLDGLNRGHIIVGNASGIPTSLAQGTNGQVLTMDSNGDADWAAPASVTTVTVSDSSANTAFPLVFHDESNGLLDDTDTLTYNPSTGLLVAPGEIEAASLDISGDVDIDGTMEADAITVNGTALDTHIAGITVTNATNATNSTNATTATNANHVSVADNESTDENNLIPFIEDASATGNVGLESDGDFHYNPSTGKLTCTTISPSTQANTLNMNGEVLDNAKLQSYTEKTHTFTWDTSGNASIDLANANIFVFNIQSTKNITGFNVTNVVSDANTMQSFTIIINQPTGGSDTPGTIDFSTGSWSATDDTSTSKTGTLKWQGGVEPTESNAVSKTDMYTFWTVDNGNTFYGCVAGVGW